MDSSMVNEEWFLQRLESGDVDASEMVEVFGAMALEGRGSEADSWAKMLFQKLADGDKLDQALAVMEWLAAVRGTIADVRTSVEKLFAKDRNALKMVEPAGFGGTLSVAECFKRLRHLRSLKTGMLCYNATWGFGIIGHVDFFYQQLEIDFEQKGEHELSFGYAAEALEILGENHILAIKHSRAAELDRLIKEEPAEVVRITLRSYGNMPVARIQEKLVPSILPESGWKKFWDGARAALKDDASVEIPKKRSDNIVLHKNAMAYDDTWYGLVAAERDIEVLFDRFKEIVEKKIDTSSAFARATLANRLGFIIKGAPSSKPEWKAEGIVYSRTFGIEPEGLDSDRLVEELMSGDLVGVLDSLQARQMQAFLTMLIECDQATTIATLREVIPVVSHPVLNEIMAVLIDNGIEDEVREIMAVAVARRTASAPMLLWIQRSTDLVAKWNLISQADLAFRIQEVLEVNGAGTVLRAQNQLRERFQQQDWLHAVMEGMTEHQRRDFLRRIHEGHGWDILDRKSISAKILRKYPELQDIILPSQSAAPKKEVPLTSNRSYAEKQRHLERIMTVEIPENSKEIEVARSYGDLRENAEFKYAKERQGLLMAQAGQLAADLERVKPTDFRDVALSQVTMGCGIELAYANGSSETYYILGVWDQDETLSIISSETRLAKALMGHKAGEHVVIPAGECVVQAILPLTEAVRAWISA